MSKWVCQVRPGNPREGRQLQPGDFFRPDKVMYIIFEPGIEVDTYAHHSHTVILKNEGFCVVKKPFTPKTTIRRQHSSREEYSHTTVCPSIFCVCLPENVQGREVVFYSPTINPLTIR